MMNDGYEERGFFHQLLDNNNNGMFAGQDTSGWRNQYPRDYRLGNIYFIKSKLTNQIPFAGRAEMQNIENIVKGCEERAYAAASSKSDYIGTIRQDLERHSWSWNLMTCSAQSNASHTVPNVVEYPLSLEQLQNLVASTLTAAVGDISSFVSIYGMAGSTPGNGCGSTVGENLVAIIKCCRQARTFFTLNGTSGTKRARHSTIVTPFDGISSFSSLHDRLSQLNGTDDFELESTAASNFKGPWNKPNHALIEEIAKINQRLVDTVVDIVDEDVVQTAVASAAEGGEGIIVKCSYKPVALSPTLKYKLTSAQMSPIQPLILLIPTDYPNSSPIDLDKSLATVSSEEYGYFSTEVISKFNIFLPNLTQPVSLSEVARTWDICARAVVSEFAQQRGGGTFSTKYGCDIKCS